MYATEKLSLKAAVTRATEASSTMPNTAIPARRADSVSRSETGPGLSSAIAPTMDEEPARHRASSSAKLPICGRATLLNWDMENPCIFFQKYPVRATKARRRHRRESLFLPD